MKTVLHTGRPTRDGEARSALDIHRTPVTDWSFHTATPAFRGGASFGSKRASFRALRALGNSYFNAEAKRHETIDAAIFALIVTLSVWPIALAAQGIWQLMK